MTTKPTISFVNYSEIVNWSVRYLLKNSFGYNKKYNLFKISDFLQRNRNTVTIKNDVIYSRVTIKLYNKGIQRRDQVDGGNIGTKKQYIIKYGQFIISKIDARNGAFGIVPEFLDEAITTADFLSYDIDIVKINPSFLRLLTSTKQFLAYCQGASSGTTGRQRINENSFLNVKIPLPPLEKQNRIVDAYNKRIALSELHAQQVKQLVQDVENYLFDILGIKKLEKEDIKKGLQFLSYKTLNEWGIDKITDTSSFVSNKYDLASFAKDTSLAINIVRGKSPQYKFNSDAIILNQKCNRWNEVQLKFAKTVNEKWLNSIENQFFTQKGDILINSTGEGTIGRSTCITKNSMGLLYDSHILLLRTNKEKINPLFYTYVFNSHYGQRQVENIKSAQSTKQTELGVSNLKKIVFPLPPIKIQTEIANNIAKMKSKIKTLQKQADENRKLAIKEFEKEIFQ
jgi:restriction endonuclease S subunit